VEGSTQSPPTRGHVIDGTGMAQELKTRFAAALDDLDRRGVAVGLGVVLVGDNYGADRYERRLYRLADELGCRYALEAFGNDAEEADVVAAVGKLNADPRITGILILRPLPGQVSEARIFRSLDPAKDIEAVHPENAGLLALGQPRFVPSTPASCFHMLDQYVLDSGRDHAAFYHGLNLVLVGRSNNVGKPALWLGLARDATVVSCHRATYEAGRLPEHTREADVLIVAAGIAGLVTGDDVREGVIAIDVGINPRTDPETGRVKMVGDLDFESVKAKAEALSPVPGGVGPITDVWLIGNTAKAAALRAGLAEELGFHPGLGPFALR